MRFTTIAKAKAYLYVHLLFLLGSGTLGEAQLGSSLVTFPSTKTNSRAAMATSVLPLLTGHMDDEPRLMV